MDPGLLGAVGLLATPRFALDLDVVAGGVQARCWHRQSGEAVASLATADGLVFELAWFPTWAWSDELSRVAVIPEDLPLAESRVPGFVDLPHELADAGVEAVRSHRSDLLPVLAAQHRGRVTDRTGDVLTDLEVGTVLTALASEPQGRLRALVADVSGAAATTVGVVAWTLVGDGWRALRPHTVDERLHVEVRRVIPEDLATDLAPVLAAVTSAMTETYDRLLALADVFDSAGAELRSRAGLGAEVLRDPAVTDTADLAPTTYAQAEDDVRAATTGKHGLMTRSLELDADALVVRATVVTYQWIDDLRTVAASTLGSVAGRAVGFLAPDRRARRRGRERRPDRDRRARPGRGRGLPLRAGRRQPRAPRPRGQRRRRAAGRSPDAGAADGRVPLGRARPSGSARRPARHRRRAHAGRRRGRGPGRGLRSDRRR